MVLYRAILASIACLLMLGGCAAYPLMPTPNIYAGESGYPEDQVPEALKSNHVDLLYVTDRSPEFDTNGNLSYGSKRSDSIDFAASAHAEIWHFLGRRGVPILYSWPAAHGGLLGYFVDRESCEFTIYPLPRACRGPGRRPRAACSAGPPRATARLRIPATRRGHRRAYGGRSHHLR